MMALRGVAPQWASYPRWSDYAVRDALRPDNLTVVPRSGGECIPTQSVGTRPRCPCYSLKSIARIIAVDPGVAYRRYAGTSPSSSRDQCPSWSFANQVNPNWATTCS